MTIWVKKVFVLNKCPSRDVEQPLGVHIVRIILKENDEVVFVKETENPKYRYKNTGNTKL